jgi:hypothetical protein
LGNPAGGNIAPLKNHIGIMTKFMIVPNPWNEVIRAAITMPSPVDIARQKRESLLVN